MSSHTETLGDALPKEIARCQELLLIDYASIGTAGAFASAMIRGHIATAQKAMVEGDTMAMLRAYNDLKGCE